MDLTQQLTALIGAENIYRNTDLLIDNCAPGAVISPQTNEAVAEVLRFANTEGLTVLPLGAGTRLHVGNIPRRVDIVLSTARLNQVLEYEPADQTILVGAGCSLVDFFQTTSKYGQWLPLDPPGSSQSTIGGTIASNAYGPLRAHYGTPRDYVIGLKVITANGMTVKTGGRVVKNVAGYDLNKLFIGSWGTLGVIVEVGCKLRPVPETEQTCLVGSETAGPLGLLAKQILNSPLAPISLEMLDAKAMRHCEIAPGTAEWALLVRFGESQPAVEYQVAHLEQLAAPPAELKFLKLPEEVAGYAWNTINNFEQEFAAEITLRASVLPSQVAEVVTDCHQRLKTCGPRFAILSHAANGVVRVYLKYVEESTGAQRRLIQAIREWRAALAPQGSLVIERAPVAFKEELEVWGEAREIVPLLRGLKQKFDPKNTLNPGRFVAGI